MPPLRIISEIDSARGWAWSNVGVLKNVRTRETSCPHFLHNILWADRSFSGRTGSAETCKVRCPRGGAWASWVMALPEPTRFCRALGAASENNPVPGRLLSIRLTLAGMPCTLIIFLKGDVFTGASFAEDRQRQPPLADVLHLPRCRFHLSALEDGKLGLLIAERHQPSVRGQPSSEA